MKLLLIDFLKRWRWIYILVGMVQVGGGLLTAITGLSFVVFLVVFCGTVLLSFDLANGTARVCQTLPISRRELATVFRVLAMVVPIVVLTAALVLGSLLRVVLNIGVAVSLSQGTLWIVYASLWLGSSFYLLTHLPRTAPLGFEAQAKTTVVGGLWGLSLGGGALLSMILPKDWHSIPPWLWCVMALAGVFGVLGWFRAESMIIARSAPNQTNESHAAPPRPSTSLRTSKFVGLPFLFGTSLWFSLGTTCTFAAVFICVQILLHRGSHEPLSLVAARALQDPTTFFILAPLVIVNGLRWLVTLRHLRVLPMSGLQVVLVVAAFFIVPSLILITVMGVFQMLGGSQFFSSEWLSRAMIMTSPILLMPALLLHFGMSRKSFFLVIMLGVWSAPMLGLLAPQISNPIRLVIWAGAWAAGAWFMHRAICTRSQTYRQPINWPGATG